MQLQMFLESDLFTLKQSLSAQYALGIYIFLIPTINSDHQSSSSKCSVRTLFAGETVPTKWWLYWGCTLLWADPESFGFDECKDQGYDWCSDVSRWAFDGWLNGAIACEASVGCYCFDLSLMRPLVFDFLCRQRVNSDERKSIAFEC